MINIKLIFIFLLVLLFSTILTGLVKKYAIKLSILDIPNDRSSHYTPTARGGGIAIVVTFLISLLVLAFYKIVDLDLFYALVGGGVLVALVGYCDDVFSVKNKWRILIHFVAAIWATYWLKGFPFLELGPVHLFLGWMGYCIAVVSIVWCINFYNFMDGIDGLASSEGVFVALAVGIALTLAGTDNLAHVMYLLVAAITGFAIWNWPPAKIFMGDVCSGFLGYIFAVLAFYTANKELLPIAFWLIALSVFIWDATFTLLYRIYKRKKWYLSHREHAYQTLISCGVSHKKVTLSIIALNGFLLIPMAFFTIYLPFYTVWFIVSTIIICLLLWFGIKSKSWS